MTTHRKGARVEKRSELEQDYAEMFRMPALPLNWIVLPDSMSLEQPSPLQVVPMTAADTVDEQALLGLGV